LVDRLRPYQQEIARAILSSVFEEKGLTLSVEIARQGGKNELSAQMELLLMTLYMAGPPRNLIKCAPTFKPQTVISMVRLKDRLNDAGFLNLWRSSMGYIIRLGNSRAIFLSADRSANTVGNTAHLLLEIDEAQDIDKQVFSRDFKPMGASTNVTTVLYGTAWDDTTLLEEVKQNNLELERKDGLRRHFCYDWESIARFNPAYAGYVENERQRLGENHPLFLTQYLLKPLTSGGGFFSRSSLAIIKGSHSRRSQPDAGCHYVAGIDIAGEAEETCDALSGMRPRPDSTVVTIAAISPMPQTGEPCIRIVEHYSWTGQNHASLHPKLVHLLGKFWKCSRVTADSTGLGQPVASFLRAELGSKVESFNFTSKSKSELGFELLSAVNSGRVKMYAGDGSGECEKFWSELERAKAGYSSGGNLNFYVERARGNDDFLMSLALTVRAARGFRPRLATGV